MKKMFLLIVTILFSLLLASCNSSYDLDDIKKDGYYQVTQYSFTKDNETHIGYKIIDTTIIYCLDATYMASSYVFYEKDGDIIVYPKKVTVYLDLEDNKTGFVSTKDIKLIV